MSFLQKRPKVDAKPVDPIQGYFLISVNSTPALKRPVSLTQKTDVAVELTQLSSQLWKLFGAAISLTLEFCCNTDNSRDIIVNFTR